MDRHPRIHVGVMLIIAVVFVLASLPALAQARNTASNNAQAVLHIRVNIVPVVMSAPPPTEPKIPLVGAVSYQVSTTNSSMEMTEEIHPLFLPTSKTDRAQGALLKTLTVVLH